MQNTYRFRSATKKLTAMALLSAFAYAVMAVGRIPLALGFLEYDPKDIIIAMGGFMYGPLAAMAVSITVSLVEMFTLSDSGLLGCLMNILSTCAFVCPAALVYKIKRTQSGAAAGLFAGYLCMIVSMLLWNYLIAPLHMNVPRKFVADLLIPVFLPFNAIKGGLNTALTILLYKPASAALQRAGLLPRPELNTKKRTGTVVTLILAGTLLVLGIVGALLLSGVIG